MRCSCSLRYLLPFPFFEVRYIHLDCSPFPSYSANSLKTWVHGSPLLAFLISVFLRMGLGATSPNPTAGFCIILYRV